MNTTSLPPRPIKPIVLFREEAEITHRPPYYFCNDASCPCHNDPQLNRFLERGIMSGEVTPRQAISIYWNQQEEGEQQ